MKKFMYVYFGGMPPMGEAAAKESMKEWTQYFEKIGKSIVDAGAPFGEYEVVGGGTESGANGYSIINAKTLADAVALTDGNPMIAAGGSIEVFELMPMGK